MEANKASFFFFNTFNFGIKEFLYTFALWKIEYQK